MRTRQMVVAFLERSSSILLLHRSEGARLFPGVWAGVGGHIEPSELNDLEAAILREIREETTLTAEEIEDLRLTAIVLRLAGDEIRQQYVYFGRVARDVPEVSPEGDLVWIPRQGALDLPASVTTRAILSRHISRGFGQEVAVGVVQAGPNGPETRWTDLSDWEPAPAPRSLGADVEYGSSS